MSSTIVNAATIAALLFAFVIAAVEFAQSKKELRRKNNLEFLQARRKLRDTLIELMRYPKDCCEYYNLRRTIDPVYIFDKSQPLLPKDSLIPNEGFYRTIFDDLYDLSSEIKIWFPNLEKQYTEFLLSASQVLPSTLPPKEKFEKAKKSYEIFDKIIEQMNTIMSQNIQ